MASRSWLLWLLAAGALGGYLARVLFGEEDRTVFLPGRTTHGHYPIEEACATCHRVGFKDLRSSGITNAACLKCHQKELDDASDSHPVKKFRDPRQAALLGRIDAVQCVTCHREHDEKLTRPVGVTQPLDYCAHCHQSIADDRPSHRGLAFASCSTAGCHNFHDNRALYEGFLVRHAGDPDHLAVPRIPWLEAARAGTAASLAASDADAPADRRFEPRLIADWAETAHAKAGVNCSGCHAPVDAASGRRAWRDDVAWTSCRTCHARETEGFLGGKHGMRLAQGLSPMSPAAARLAMKPEAAHRTLGCVSCHGAHRFDRRTAAVEGCLACHDDTHTRRYVDSPHFALWEKERRGLLPRGSGVSCATCHLPREVDEGSPPKKVVEHNPNANLRPNEKMVRTTCLHCHGLAFSLDAMADPALIERNFAGRPAVHVGSVEMAYEREQARREHEQKQKETQIR